MDLSQPRHRLLAFGLLLAGLAVLYRDALTAGFLNDDFLFLEAAKAGAFARGVQHGALANYFRPVSRELWFGLGTLLAGDSALAFHLALFGVFALALVLLFDLLTVFTSEHAALAGVVAFALLPLQRVNLMWVSCSQDLLALAGVLAAIACFRRGRDRLAWLAYLVAALSKQSALPLPALLALWAVWVDGAAPRAAVRRVAPFVLPALAWAAGETVLRTHSKAAAVLHFGLADFAAAYAHAAQSLLGLESPGELPRAFGAARPSWLALVLLAPLALAWPAAAPAAAPRASRPASPRGAAFALAWIAAFTLPTWPVAHYWSAYFYTSAAVGAAILFAIAAGRLGRIGFVAALMGALWLHAAASAVPAFAVAEEPWTWTSHLTPAYFARGAALARQLRAALTRGCPSPAHGTRFFFATLPPHAGFQMGNGAAIRHAYRDPSLESWFYSQFDERTAADRPCVFLFWNGADFERLYDRSADPYFQVGTDLLLLGRPNGATHAFRRGLAAHETSVDNLYWLGWARMWANDRDGAEAAWSAFGAHDDTTMYVFALRAARTALDARDTTTARRQIFTAIRAGIGRPEGHAELGELLRARSRKFALLETRVASWLKPDDWLARRDLVEGLVAARLDEPAARELAALQQMLPDWRGDTLIVRLARTLAEREPLARAVVSYGAPARETTRGGTP